jgi:hypothetical protein
VNFVTSLRIRKNAGRFLSGCKTSGLYSSSLLHRASYLEVQKQFENPLERERVPLEAITKKLVKTVTGLVCVCVCVNIDL